MDSKAAAVRSEDQTSRRKSAHAGVSISFAFAALTASVVILTAGVLLVVVQDFAVTSIKELVRQKAEIVSLTIVERVKTHLEPVVAQSVFTARIISEMDPAEASQEAVGARLYAALAASPQVSSIALVDRDYIVLRSFRNRPEARVQTTDWSDAAAFKAMLEPAWDAPDPFWGPLFYAERSKATLLNFLAPVQRGAETSYILVTGVSLVDLANFVKSLQSEMTGQAFILHGKDGVLASSQLDGIQPQLSDRRPLPGLADIGGTPLSHIWSSNRLRRVEADLVNELEARVVHVDGESYVFLFRELNTFGEEPWYVGSYLTLDELAPQLARNKVIVAIALIIISAGGLVALILGRLVSRPIRGLATAADRLNQWRFDSDADLPPSAFREINEANSAFRSAIRAMRSLQIYIPRPLARRLIEHGDPAAIRSEEHEVSILFTDIVDFTGLAERMPSDRVVKLLNSHFTLLASCIEAENGIVDKFIGDSTMAFWGGLKSDEAHSTHACRAAIRIAKAMFDENGARRARGEPPIRVRIGIHSGKAMIGNIGAPGRINYTVIGDSVNTAKRLEMLSREVGENDSEVVTLVSGETAMRLGPEFLTSRVGRKVLHGRHAETEVFMLKGPRIPGGPEPAAGER